MYTNTSHRRDFFQNAFVEHSRTPCQVLLAVAFLTDAEPLLDLVRRGCRVKLIVRLGFPTSPDALRKLLGVEGLQARYINNPSFHPKLYIFSERCALVGSSNLTHSALTTNQEVNVTVPVDDHRYDDLVALFWEYWPQVRVLNEPILSEYAKIYDRYRAARRDLDRAETDVMGLAQTRIDNVGRGKREHDIEDAFLEEYRATYQGFLDAFRTVQRVYVDSARRKVAEDALPLRLEVDSFLSWVREVYTTGDSYLKAPLLHGDELDAKVGDTIASWFGASYRWFEEEVVPKRYPRIIKILRSEEAIEQASYEELLDALSVVHSFYDRLRFFPGGHAAHVAAFREANDLKTVKRTLRYLLFGGGDPVVRMGRCVFDPQYKLAEFGRSAVQELLGWVNSDDIPACNSRTLRSLRWLGFDVVLVGG